MCRYSVHRPLNKCTHVSHLFTPSTLRNPPKRSVPPVGKDPPGEQSKRSSGVSQALFPAIPPPLQLGLCPPRCPCAGHKPRSLSTRGESRVFPASRCGAVRKLGPCPSALPRPASTTWSCDSYFWLHVCPARRSLAAAAGPGPRRSSLQRGSLQRPSGAGTHRTPWPGLMPSQSSEGQAGPMQGWCRSKRWQ